MGAHQRLRIVPAGGEMGTYLSGQHVGAAGKETIETSRLRIGTWMVRKVTLEEVEGWIFVSTKPPPAILLFLYVACSILLHWGPRLRFQGDLEW